jgi:hypothetical protein
MLVKETIQKERGFIGSIVSEVQDFEVRKCSREPDGYLDGAVGRDKGNQGQSPGPFA